MGKYCNFYYFILLGACASSSSRRFEVSETEFLFLSSERNLQASPATLKIFIQNAPDISLNTISVLQDPCIISSQNICTKDPAYTTTQISQPISLPFSRSTLSLVYEYTGYYTSPISIDIYQHSPGVFTQDHYSNPDLTGTFTTTTITSLYFSGSSSIKSSYVIYGYIKGPRDGAINFEFYHDDGGEISINGVLILSNILYGTDYFTYTMVKDIIYYIKIILHDGAGLYGMGLSWDLSGSFITIDSDYIIHPNRLTGLPYLLDGLKYNTYCNDMNGFNCVVCDGLCVECQESISIKVCTSCRPNTTLSSGVCSCIPTYYLSASDPNNCIPCTGLCNECEEVSEAYRCKSCKTNAIHDSTLGSCSCNRTYYLAASDPYNCKPCTGLCNECEEVSESYRCISCKQHTIFDYLAGKCNCDFRYYLSLSDSGNCMPCTGLCDECEEVDGKYRCKSCKYSSTLDISSGLCTCNPTFYLSASNPEVCQPCKELCEECEEVDGEYRCKSCKENSSLDPSSGTCTCNSAFYLSDEDPRMCTRCNSLCSSCEERLDSDDCICNEGYYKPYSDYDHTKCYTCPSSCKTCDENSNGVFCTSCKEKDYK